MEEGAPGWWIGFCVMDKPSKRIDLKRDFNLGDFRLTNFVHLGVEKERVRRWRNDEAVRKWMYSDHLISKREHQRFIEGLRRDRKNFYWRVENGEGETIGVISLNKVDFENKNAYLGVYANPDFEGRGAGSGLIGSLKRLSFEVANLHTLRLEVIDGNERALRFYRKAGFKREGRLKEFIFKEGRWKDVIVMGMIHKKGAAP